MCLAGIYRTGMAALLTSIQRPMRALAIYYVSGCAAHLRSLRTLFAYVGICLCARSSHPFARVSVTAGRCLHCLQRYVCILCFLSSNTDKRLTSCALMVQCRCICAMLSLNCKTDVVSRAWTIKPARALIFFIHGFNAQFVRTEDYTYLVCSRGSRNCRNK